jgi:hypothetical protein
VKPLLLRDRRLGGGAVDVRDGHKGDGVGTCPTAYHPTT